MYKTQYEKTPRKCKNKQKTKHQPNKIMFTWLTTKCITFIKKEKNLCSDRSHKFQGKARLLQQCNNTLCKLRPISGIIWKPELQPWYYLNYLIDKQISKNETWKNWDVIYLLKYKNWLKASLIYKHFKRDNSHFSVFAELRPPSSMPPFISL